MVVKDERSVDRDFSQVDEGWWASVLADDEQDHSHGHERSTVAELAPLEETSVDWIKAQKIYDNDEIVVMKVYAFNRGGLLVNGQGVQGFVPVSHLVEMAAIEDENERRERLAHYLGCSLQLKIIECEPAMERIVFSERAALAGEGQRKQLFKSLKADDVVTGTVTNVTDFGAFVDLGGVEGLIHVSELSWGRVNHPSEVLKVNQTVSALVLQVSEENVRVALSLKRLCPNPWETLVENYHSGDEVRATITAIKRYGVFARLDEGVEGLVHISSMNLGTDIKDLNHAFRPGQVVRVEILHIDSERRRLGLGLVDIE
ncbi:MAG: 30S ribosomal protein S1 [Chloroflexi bacterium]|nr:30S ribosomal protein S1 [Chloroflexota bacterium]